MNIAYFGSPSISATVLEKLINNQDGFTISLVITQPDKPVGKRLEIQPTEVKRIAQAYKIPIFDKDLKFNENELVNTLKINDIDLCIIFAYGKIISKNLLEIPRHGFWNIHPSLLPLYRGPSPVAYALILGDKKTGVSLIQLAEQMDAGPIIDQVETNIELNEDRITLEHRLTLMGIKLLMSNLKKLIINHKIESKPQNDTLTTYSYLLKKEDGYVSLNFIQKALNNEPVTINEFPSLLKNYFNKYMHIPHKNLTASLLLNNYYLGLNPWPGIWTKIIINSVEKRLKINILSLKENKIQLDFVQLEGKSIVDFKTFNKSYNIFPEIA